MSVTQTPERIEALLAEFRTRLDALENQSPDLLYGVPAIAKVLGLTVRQARHLTDKQAVPTFRILSTICARRSTLNAWLTEQEAASALPIHTKTVLNPTTRSEADHGERS